MSDPESDEDLDPRVQEELEKLNQYTDEINQLELQLEEANGLFRTLLTDSTHQLKAMSKKLGPCIEKARPYYEALKVYQAAQRECQSAATHYQRASGIHLAAKETIALAEERFQTNVNNWEFDNAWQEMLNHATIKVGEAEKQKRESEAEHKKKSAAFQEAESDVQQLEKKLNKFIQKSQPYFEQKEVFNKTLAAQKDMVEDLQQKIMKRKALYAQSLRNLEEISESIHKRRRLKIPPRDLEVGAEKKSIQSMPSYDLDRCDPGVGSLTEDEDSSSIKGCEDIDDGFQTDYSSTSVRTRDGSLGKVSFEDSSVELCSIDGASSVGYSSQFSVDSGRDDQARNKTIIAESAAVDFDIEYFNLQEEAKNLIRSDDNEDFDEAKKSDKAAYGGNCSDHGDSFSDLLRKKLRISWKNSNPTSNTNDPLENIQSESNILDTDDKQGDPNLICTNAGEITTRNFGPKSEDTDLIAERLLIN